jgi:hypothetical protein
MLSMTNIKKPSLSNIIKGFHAGEGHIYLHAKEEQIHKEK